MKLQGIYLLLVPALLSVSSCSDPEHSGFEQVPIELRASGNGEVITKADPIIANAFPTTIFASKRDGIYTGIPSDADEWQKNSTVQTDGSVSLPDNPSYPKNGDWIYLVAVSPEVASSNNTDNGTVTYTLDGQTDLMYAKQIKGNRWDGSRFSSNTDNKKDTPLEYVHQLTQLVFKAQKAAAGGLTVKVNSIAIKSKKGVSITLSSGETTFSGTDEEVTLTLPSGGTDISATTPVDLGCLLLPPLETGAYKLTAETSIGTFKDLNISFESAGGNEGNTGSNQFARGHSYVITLNIGDRELGILSVTAAQWTTVEQNGNGDLDLMK